MRFDKSRRKGFGLCCRGGVRVRKENGRPLRCMGGKQEIQCICRVTATHAEYVKSDFTTAYDRTLDEFTRKVLYTAHRLLPDGISETAAERTGAVLSTCSGPESFLRETAALMESDGYRRINPSRFPHVMLSCALSYLTLQLRIHGPSCVLYDDYGNGTDAVKYCLTQLHCGRADDMVLICADEGGRMSGRLYRRRPGRK